MELVKLNYVKNHSHVAYLRDDGTGVTSTDNSHFHELIFNRPMPTMQPPMQPPISEGAGEWEVLPAANGHTHSITEFTGYKAPKFDKEQMSKEVVALFKQLKRNEEEDRARGEEADRFYQGEQWEKADIDYLRSKGRAALTLNHVQPSIDLLSGYQRQNRTDPRFSPVEDSDSRVADMLNIVVKQILEQSNFYAEQSRQFEDEIIAGRGVIELIEEPTDEGEIEPRISHIDWDAIYLGPHSKQDLSDLLVMCKSKWYTRNELERLFPDLAGKLPAPEDLDEDRSGPHQNNDQPYTPEQSETVKIDTAEIDSDLVNLSRDEYRVIECVRKEYSTVPIAVDPSTGFVRNLIDLSRTETNQIKSIPDLRVIPRQTYRMRVTRTLANLFIDDEYPDWSYNDFGICVAYAYFRKGSFWGKVEAMKDPQREINKRHSQATDILNRAAGYGWFFDSGTFPNQALKSHFEENASVPGFVQEISDINRPPRQQEGTKAPVEVLEMERGALEQFRAISNISNEMLGQPSNASSGVAMLERKRQGLIGSERLFDALSMSQKKLAKMLVNVISKHYSPNKIARIIQSAGQADPTATIGNNPVSQYSLAEIEQMLANADLTKYDVFITEAASSPTTAYANFMIMSDLAKQGLPIPNQLLIKMATLPE